MLAYILVTVQEYYWVNTGQILRHGEFWVLRLKIESRRQTSTSVSTNRVQDGLLFDMKIGETQ